MRPADLLGMQADFLRRYLATEDNPDTVMMKVQVTATDRAIRARETGVEVNGHDLSAALKNGQYAPMAVDAVHHAAKAAQGGMPIIVTPEMVDLVSWVADDLPDLDEATLAVAPSAYGFVWLEKPILVPGASGLPEDRHDPDTYIDLLLWSPVPRLNDGSRFDRHAVTFQGFNSSLRPDPITVRWTEASSVDGYGAHPYNLAFVSALIDGEKHGPSGQGPMFCRPMVYNAEPGPTDGPAEGRRMMEYATWGGPNMGRWLYALWIVMGQEIADVREQHPDRATKRRMVRMNLPPAVTVITLRRPPGHRREDDETQVEWQHHWFVRGHPRWQAYGPGRQERKLIWIAPHVKGNLDAPLKQTTKVYVVKR